MQYYVVLKNSISRPFRCWELHKKSQEEVCKQINIFSNFKQNLYVCNSEFESQCCIDEIVTLYYHSYPNVAYSVMLRIHVNLPSQRNGVVAFSNTWNSSPFLWSTSGSYFLNYWNLFSDNPSLTIFRMGGGVAKRPPYQFFPCNFYKSRN